MTIRQALAAALQLFVLFAFFALGFFFVSLSFLHDVRTVLFGVLLDRPDLCALVGIGSFTAALLSAFGFYALNRGQYLLLQMGHHWLEIDREVLRQTVEPALRKEFADKLTISHIEIARKKEVEIGLFIAPMEEEEREQLLLRAEQHLETLLRERFGYRRPFKVQVLTSKL
ncbi:MAG: hypothetical protein KGJ02_00890 [Verrucomicrobiota bacterium]|nr:hypothetical protein [Verrucomicrobiota bacterium]